MNINAIELQTFKLDVNNMNSNPVVPIELQYFRDVQGISVSSPYRYQIDEIARLILSGIAFDIDNVGAFFTGNVSSQENIIQGCIYQVSLTLPSYDCSTILVRLLGKKPAICKHDLDLQSLGPEEIPKLTFRIGNKFGVFILSAYNEIIDFSTNLSEVEVIGGI